VKVFLQSWEFEKAIGPLFIEPVTFYSIVDWYTSWLISWTACWVTRFLLNFLLVVLNVAETVTGSSWNVYWVTWLLVTLQLEYFGECTFKGDYFIRAFQFWIFYNNNNILCGCLLLYNSLIYRSHFYSCSSFFW